MASCVLMLVLLPYYSHAVRELVLGTGNATAGDDTQCQLYAGQNTRIYCTYDIPFVTGGLVRDKCPQLCQKHLADDDVQKETEQVETSSPAAFDVEQPDVSSAHREYSDINSGTPADHPECYRYEGEHTAIYCSQDTPFIVGGLVKDKCIQLCQKYLVHDVRLNTGQVEISSPAAAKGEQPDVLFVRRGYSNINSGTLADHPECYRYAGTFTEIYCVQDVPFIMGGLVKDKCKQLCQKYLVHDVRLKPGHVEASLPAADNGEQFETSGVRRGYSDINGGTSADHPECYRYAGTFTETYCIRDVAFITGGLVKDKCMQLCQKHRVHEVQETPGQVETRSLTADDGQQPDISTARRVYSDMSSSTATDHLECYRYDGEFVETYCTQDVPFIVGGLVKDKCMQLCQKYLIHDVRGKLGGQVETGSTAADNVEHHDASIVRRGYSDIKSGTLADHPECYRYDVNQIAMHCTQDVPFVTGGLFKDKCAQLCQKHIAAAGVRHEYVDLLEWKAPPRCQAQVTCVQGGYSAAQTASFSWDMCSGCWQETCTRDINIESVIPLFKPHDRASGFYAGVSLLEHVYPIGAAMWKVQKRGSDLRAARTGEDTWSTRLLEGIVGFMSTESIEKWLNCVNSPVHENTHVVHHSTGVYRPSNDFDYAIAAPWQMPCTDARSCEFPVSVNGSVDALFPRRGEINYFFPEDIQQAIGGPSYFQGDLTTCELNEGGAMGCQQLNGLMSETEAYLHGQIASSVFGTGVGAGNYWIPHIIPHNNADSGGTFPVAFWSLANVLYLQRIKTRYPRTWDNLLNQGSEDWRKISELFLAHIDRSTWFLRLTLDVNDMTDFWHQKGVPPDYPPYKALSNKCRRLQLEALQSDDVLTPLRRALQSQGCSRSGR